MNTRDVWRSSKWIHMLMHENDKLRSEKEIQIRKCQRHKYQTVNSIRKIEIIYNG